MLATDAEMAATAGELAHWRAADRLCAQLATAWAGAAHGAKPRYDAAHAAAARRARRREDAYYRACFRHRTLAGLTDDPEQDAARARAEYLCGYISADAARRRGAQL